MIAGVAVAGALVALLARVDEAVAAGDAAARARLPGRALGVRGARLREREGAVRHRDDRAAVGRAGEAPSGREAARLAGRPAEARRRAVDAARIALLVRPDEAVATALGRALPRIEGAVGAAPERAAGETERGAARAAQIGPVTVLARLDAGHRPAGGGTRTLARASRGHAHLARPRAGAAAVAVFERLDLAVAARGARREG